MHSLGNVYTAGNNITINNNVISVDGINFEDGTLNNGVNVNTEMVEAYGFIPNPDYVEGSDDPEVFYNGIAVESGRIRFYSEVDGYDVPLAYSPRDSALTLDGTIIGGNPLPSYSSSDAGKVLSVDSNGDLEWISIPSANGVSF